MLKTQEITFAKVRNQITNIEVYACIMCLNSGILIWPVLILFYQNKGLTFSQVAILQSVSSAVTLIMEVPLGLLADRIGQKKILILGEFVNLVSFSGLIIVSGYLSLILVSVLSACGEAAVSGADVALLYNYLEKSNQEGEFSNIRARVRQKQSVIRIFARSISTVLYGINILLPFVISIFIKTATFICTFFFKENNYTAKDVHEEKKTKKRFVDNIKSEYIKYMVLGAGVTLVFCEVSQYLAPAVTGAGFKVSFLGIVLSAGSLMDYFGSKCTENGKIRSNCSRLAFMLCITTTVCFKLRVPFMMIIGYLVASFLFAPFSIKLSTAINNVIDSNNRATLLSIENQFESIVLFVTEPLLGLGFDQIGVPYTLAIVSFIVYLIILCICGKGVRSV